MKYRKRKRDIDPRYLFIIGVLIITSIIIILTITLNDERELTAPEKVIRDVFNTTINFFSYPFFSLQDRGIDVNELTNPNYEALKAENILLRQKVNELESLLELESDNYQRLTVRVINRNVGTWFNQLNINKGSRHGIEPGMAVVTHQGLIGTIISTSYTTSTVRLITTDNTHAILASTIITEDGLEQGFIQGFDPRERLLSFNKINDNYRVRIGDAVTTSSLNPNIPGGVKIGTVSGMVNDEFGLTTIIKVRPVSNFNNLTFLSVLIREES